MASKPKSKKKIVIIVLAVIVVICCIIPFGIFIVDASLRQVGILPTYTPKPTNTDTPIPSSTPFPTDIPIPSSTSLPTNTHIPNATLPPTETLVPSNTPIPSDTPVPTITPTPTQVILTCLDIELVRDVSTDLQWEEYIRSVRGSRFHFAGEVIEVYSDGRTQINDSSCEHLLDGVMLYNIPRDIALGISKDQYVEGDGLIRDIGDFLGLTVEVNVETIH